MFIIPCKFDKNYPIIFQCIESIIKLWIQLLFGAGGHSKDLAYLANYDKFSKWNIVGYLDDNKDLEQDSIIGSIKDLPKFLDKYSSLYYTIAINSSSIRKHIDKKYGNSNRAANLIHETAVIGSNCTYGNGVTMGPYSVLTTMVQLGIHVHINTSATINQASTIGDYCTLSPGSIICGDVKIGSTTSIGAGAVVINFKTIGSDVTLGAGSVVIDNINSGTTVVGVPGREIKKIQDYI